MNRQQFIDALFARAKEAGFEACEVYYGASDKKAGAFGTLFDMNTMGLNHRPEIVGGVMEEECAKLLSDFFADLRKRKKAEKLAEKTVS